MKTLDTQAVEAFFQRNERVAFEFSGGKDSLAVLWLLQNWWDRMTVIWCNMGDPYPETIEQMEQVRRLVPHFQIVYGDSPAWIRTFGYPVDNPPTMLTGFWGQIAEESPPVRVCHFAQCCSANFWQPMHKAITSGGYVGIIRGQKASDKLKSPVVSGSIEDGIEYLFPIEDWADEDVLDFLGDTLPESYRKGMSSGLDCMHCTAYNHDSVQRVRDLRERFPSVYAEVIEVHKHTTKALIAAARDSAEFWEAVES